MWNATWLRHFKALPMGNIMFLAHYSNRDYFHLDCPHHPTLSVKRNITSSECHPLISKASTWIVFGHRLGKFILNKHIEKKEVYFNHRGDKCDEIARGQFSKITETACLSGWEFEADKSRYGVYVTRHWNWMNSYWLFWISCLRGARSVSSFCDFWKITFRDLTAFSPFWQEIILCFSAF